MPKSITVFRPGQEVDLLVPGGNPIPAQVLKVMLEADSISYEVGWFSGQTLNRQWVYEFNISAAEEQRLKMGFRSCTN